jgi:hypothetical protein
MKIRDTGIILSSKRVSVPIGGVFGLGYASGVRAGQVIQPVGDVDGIPGRGDLVQRGGGRRAGR